MSSSPHIQSFFDPATNTISYLVADPASRQAAIIDPVLDYDPASGRISTCSAQRILDAARADDLQLAYILETHAHADHLSAADWLRLQTAAPVAIGEHIRQVQEIFGDLFHLQDLTADAGDFDLLLQDCQMLPLGTLQIEVLHTPGHTPACVSYRMGDVVFVGDTLFMPDYGTARADFPGGDARRLYRSIQRLLALPPSTRLFLCHDYTGSQRDRHLWETTVASQREENVHVRTGISEQAFVALREQRDAGLAAPALLLPSIQVNIRAGRLPPAEANGTRYLKIPLRLSAGN